MVLAGVVDPRREAVLQEAEDVAVPAALARLATAGAGTPSARIVTERSTELVVAADAPAGGLLLLADTWYPGWEATVDGRPARILRANLAQRAVELAPGSHQVVFRFRSRSVFLGSFLTGLGLLALLLSAWLSRPRREGARG